MLSFYAATSLDWPDISSFLSVRSRVIKYVNTILKTDEATLLQIGTSGLRGNGIKQSTSAVKSQGHRRPKLDLEAWQRHHARSNWID